MVSADGSSSVPMATAWAPLTLVVVQRSRARSRMKRNRSLRIARRTFQSSSSGMSSTRSQKSGSSIRARHSAPRNWSKSLPMWAATQVFACTPLVTALIGRSSLGVPGQSAVNMPRVTSPCNWLTALTPAAVRIARAVMLNCGPMPLSWEPSARKRSRYSPRLPQAPAMCVSTSGNGNASWPAGTGVWVVNTVEARTCASAASKLAPCSMWSQMRCRATNAACPSFRCQTVGSMPIALSALTPPRPRTISCWSRRSWLPP